MSSCRGGGGVKGATRRTGARPCGSDTTGQQNRTRRRPEPLADDRHASVAPRIAIRIDESALSTLIANSQATDSASGGCPDRCRCSRLERLLPLRYNRRRLEARPKPAGAKRASLHGGGGGLQRSECISSQAAGADGNPSGLEAGPRLVHDAQGRRYVPP